MITGIDDDQKITRRPIFKSEFCDASGTSTNKVVIIWRFFYFCFILCSETYASTFTLAGDKSQLTPFNYAELVWMGGRNVAAFAFFVNNVRGLALLNNLAEPLVQLAGQPAIPQAGPYTVVTTMRQILSNSTMNFCFYQTVYMVSLK